jgi:hypothetical protein
MIGSTLRSAHHEDAVNPELVYCNRRGDSARDIPLRAIAGRGKSAPTLGQGARCHGRAGTAARRRAACPGSGAIEGHDPRPERPAHLAQPHATAWADLRLLRGTGAEFCGWRCWRRTSSNGSWTAPGTTTRRADAAVPGRVDQQDIKCLIEGLRLVTPCTQRIDLIDLLEQIRDGRRQGTTGPA